MNNELTKVETIKFYEDELLGIKDESGVIWLGIRKACSNFGFTEGQINRQINNISDDLVYVGNHTKFDMVQNEGGRQVNREVICLSEKVIPLWLAKISLTPAMKKENPKLVDKLIKYQLECASVLYKHFMGTEDKKKDFFNDVLGIEMKNLIELAVKESTKPLYEKIGNLEQIFNKKFKIYTNESSAFSNLLTQYCAKVHNIGTDGGLPYIYFYNSIQDWFGVTFPSKEDVKKINYKNIKDYAIKTIGIDNLEMFVNGILADRIVKSQEGHWVDLSGIYQNENIEWNKVLDNWTDKNKVLRCAYCGKNITKDEANIEHMIPQSNIDSSNRIENITCSCQECNKSKSDSTYSEWYPKQTFYKEQLSNRIESHIQKYRINKEVV